MAPQRPEHGVRIGKRFTRKGNKQVALESTKSYFAKAHQKKLDRRELLDKERKGRRHAQVALKRSYRIGELPDIVVSSQDIIGPLR